MGESAQETFLEESRELLQDMEHALLQLENTPDDADLINALFRAAHTIKGTSGVFSFEHVEAFTHVVENVLEKVRSGQIEIDGNLIAILLRCRDHIEVLVDLAVSGEENLEQDVKNLGDELRLQLKAYLGEGESEEKLQSPSKEIVEKTADIERLGEGRPVETDNWHISLRFNQDVLKSGMDPLSFLRYLRNLGDIVRVTTLCTDMPSMAEMDPESNYLGFEIEFDSDSDKEAIEQVFEFVREDCELHILSPKANVGLYAELIRELPEEDMRIGDILVRSGALTQQELEDALKLQDTVRQENPSGDDGEPKLGDVLVEQKLVHQEVIDAAVEKQSSSKERKVSNRWLRVDAQKLDQLINLVGELVIAGAGANLQATRLADEELLESMSGVNRLVEEIRDHALRLRMVQIGETFNRFQRVVRDVSRELGKDIELLINGADTELDKTVVEKIGDPLMHLVRNAIDHGLETAGERQSIGKPAKGKVMLNAYHDSGSIVIEVSDDGRGLDKDKIFKKAVEKGLVDENTNLSEQEIYRLIFEPGFSTASAVTNLSGRGVGMDVVRKNIEALRGTVDVQSEAGIGSTIRIRLPLTLAIIDGFLVGVGESAFVIPLDMVLECIELTELEREETRHQNYINLRGEVLPFLRLRDLFNENDSRIARESIVVVQYGENKAGFVVDELMGEFQTVIKPLGKIFQQLKGVSGATILGNGEVAVILDVPNLVQRAANISSQMIGKQESGENKPLLH
jgi:two-component system chemotaxis sensor kinase CheA